MQLDNFLYTPCLGFSWESDCLRLSGKVYGNPRFYEGEFVLLSTPQKFDRAARTVTTRNNVYELLNCATDEEEVFFRIEEDIKHGSSKRR